MAGQIVWTPPSEPVAYPSTGNVNAFAGYSFSVPQDGVVQLTVAGGIAGESPLVFNGPAIGFTVIPGASGALIFSGDAADIASALQGGAITYAAPPDLLLNGGFNGASDWTETGWNHTDAVFANGQASYTDPAVGTGDNFFQFGQQVLLTHGEWQLSFSYTLSDGGSHGYFGPGSLSIGWYRDSVGNNQDLNPQLPQFEVTPTGAGTAVIDFNITWAVQDWFAFQGGNANTTIGPVELTPVVPVSLTLTGPAQASATVTSQSAEASDQSIACFAAGTQILTARGEVPVEALRPGDLVPTLAGRGPALQPVIWVGRTRIDLDRHPNPGRAAPIRVQAHAFGPQTPHRDLLLSPDHSVACGGRLIPIHLMVNGASIARMPACGVVTYFHVELESHAVVLAEGLSAETYLDTGNRAVFDNAGSVRALHPGLSGIGRASDALKVWADRACSELLLGGPQVVATHRQLRDRAFALGHRLTDDPGLLVQADGHVLAAVATAPGRLCVRVPPRTAALQLRSRDFVPQEADRSTDDCRRLGVALTALALDGHRLALNGAALTNLHHPPECDGETNAWRWTDGDTTLILPPGPAVSHLDIEYDTFGTRYWNAPPSTDSAAQFA